MTHVSKPHVEFLTLESQALKGNLWGDPFHRTIGVYLPPQFNQQQHYPLLLVLAPYNNSGLGLLSFAPGKENLPQRLDRLIGTQKIPPCIAIFPDCFARLRGNQYVNSATVGAYQDFLLDEVIPAVEKVYVTGGSGQRGCIGKSSGGFGAFHQAMKRPGVFSAMASHSGGMGFMAMWNGFLPQVLRHLENFDRHIDRFIGFMETTPKITLPELQTLMFLHFGASYDPAPEDGAFGVRLPVDLYTGRVIEDRWAHWLSKDPALPSWEDLENLSMLKRLYVDCGRLDQYHLNFGARQLHQTLKQKAIAHRYEEFEDDHTDVDYRYDISLPYIMEAFDHRK